MDFVVCRAGRVHIVEILLQQNGVDVNQECGAGISPLHVSITEGHTNVVDLVLAQGIALTLTAGLLSSA